MYSFQKFMYPRVILSDLETERLKWKKRKLFAKEEDIGYNLAVGLDYSGGFL